LGSFGLRKVFIGGILGSMKKSDGKLEETNRIKQIEYWQNSAIHDLVRMADMAGVVFDEETLEFMDSINTFNISTRYPDEKLRFYKLCTHDFAKENFQRIKEIHQCLLKKMQH
jgi:HEPN domain-containing protein